MLIEINNLARAGISEKFIQRITAKVLKNLKCPKSAHISVALVGNAEIKKLNRVYRGQNRVTDVLSVARNKSEKFISPLQKNYLGEIIISYPQTKKQAQEKNYSIQQELKILLVHGLLHLVGYEHQTENERKKMEKREKEILGRFRS